MDGADVGSSAADDGEVRLDARSRARPNDFGAPVDVGSRAEAKDANREFGALAALDTTYGLAAADSGP